MKTLDLNADLAEGFPYDEPLLKLISSANIACGLHAGNAVAMRNAVRWAKENGVRIGAHPGFPDRENFGRAEMHLPADELKAHLLYQLGALQAICTAEQAEMAYVKPHGALYNQSAKDIQLARLVIETIKEFNPKLAVMGLANSPFIELAKSMEVPTISEAFADRHYLADGSLVPRSRPDAMVESDEEAIAQVLQMAQQGSVQTMDGTTITLSIESVCLHGDNQHALHFAEQLREAFAKNEIKVTAYSSQ